jgi:hypothetical protein
MYLSESGQLILKMPDGKFVVSFGYAQVFVVVSKLMTQPHDFFHDSFVPYAGQYPEIIGSTDP